jgi:hypothetical protein
MINHNILTLVVGAIIVESIGLILIYFTALTRITIRQWYNEFTIGAYTMDIASVLIGTYLATLFTSNLYLQLLYVVIIGLIHDISFGMFFLGFIDFIGLGFSYPRISLGRIPKYSLIFFTAEFL